MSDSAQNHHELIIIGSGPAGLTAAIYAARAELKPLVIEGLQAGGQLMQTTEIENYPGFPQGLQGPELMINFRDQAERFGTTFLTDDVDTVDLEATPKVIKVGKTTYTADAVIVSTGATARMIGLESEQKLLGHGVSTCATCDGYFFRDKELLVVGGGDSAMEEATFLTKFATKVTIIHRRDEYRASKIMLDRARANEKVEFIEWAAVTEVLDDDTGAMTGAILTDTRDGSTRRIDAQGLFVAIGHDPNTLLFTDQLDMDENGYLITKAPGTQTNIDGVFACGDVQDHTYRQAITAAGSGCAAALDAERWLAAVQAAGPVETLTGATLIDDAVVTT
ncbi:MAG: NADPH-dependent thioredoxin reductase [Thermoleophilia bacterium]|nr:NADPH-dependent thioredoxin reductase [Thermoleophilia bacterium]MCZ4496232.1 NADPH-dependent thioredoxin reductase [Thermoleophilia bacterium]